jgi:hypothetical protein
MTDIEGTVATGSESFDGGPTSPAESSAERFAVPARAIVVASLSVVGLLAL